MALANSKFQYVGSGEWTNNVSAWTALTSYAAGTLIRQLATPTVGNERVWCQIATVTHTSGAAEPSPWTFTKGSSTTDGTCTWIEVTGQPGVNGDTTNSPVWPTATTVTLGQIIYVASNGSLQIVTTASGNTSGSIPLTFSATAGVTTSDGSNVWTSLGLASNFGAWAAPHARTLNADAATWQTVVPATVFVSSTSNATQSTGATFGGGQGTTASPNKYLSVSSASAPPTSCTAGATENVTGTNGLTIQGFGYYFGFTFNNGSGSSSTPNLGIQPTYVQFDNCTFAQKATGGAAISFGAGSVGNSGADYLNCTFTFGATSQTIKMGAGNVNVRGGTFAPSGVGFAPNTLFTAQGIALNHVIRDADLSTVTGTLATLSAAFFGSVTLVNCKLGASVAMPAAPASLGSCTFRMHNCDSTSHNYRFFDENYVGSISSTNYGTVYDSTNPASDGTNNWAVQVVTNANASFGQPYVMEFAPIEWNNSTSALTVTIEFASGNTLTNGDIWMEVEYLGNASFPIGSLYSSRVADALTATANVATSTDSWVGSGVGTTQHIVSASITPGMKGPFKIRVFVAKASQTVYINPVPIISGVRISRTYIVPGVGIVSELGGNMLVHPGMSGGMRG